MDVCKARLKTVGVTETPLKVGDAFGNTDWLVIDIGGARTHRASWKPFFEDGDDPAPPALTNSLIMPSFSACNRFLSATQRLQSKAGGNARSQSFGGLPVAMAR